MLTILLFAVLFSLTAPLAALWVRSWRRQVARERRGFGPPPARPSWLLE